MEHVLVEYTIKTPYIVSVNNLYEPILNWNNFGGTKFCTFHGLKLSEDAVALKSAIGTELQKSGLVINKKDIDWRKPFIFSLVYILSSSYMSRDTGNMEKCVTDAIFNYFDLNDNKIAALHQYKLFNALGGSEYIKFRLSQPDLNYRDMKI